ncbi:MAG: hypothetical protein A3C35_02280 [Omnitrophica bacterium RIFCSPHIGHO2_02_FULL_46_11]|nr:MAG: hypothetical protein A3C35_02280 [Omnitrophica bacterium RIFCSPHIGHO2_02_FULL_46_11]
MKIQERDYWTMGWMNIMNHAHLEEIRDVFFPGCNPKRAPYRRMLKLIEAGLVKVVRINNDPRPLYVLTHAGRARLLAVGFQYVPALSKDKKFKHYEHDYGLIRLRTWAREQGIGIWVPERVLRSIKPRGSCPDALLLTANANYAVEYEPTQKEPIERYKTIFSRYDASKYDAVLYVLPTKARIQKLHEKLGYIQKKIFFIDEETLFRDKAKAVFVSSCDKLPVEQLIYWSRDGDVEALEREELEAVIHREDPDAWKDRKPLIGGGGHRKSEDESYDFNGESDSEPMEGDEDDRESSDAV